MNIQDDLFDAMHGISKEMREKMEKLKFLASGKYSVGLKGKKIFEAYDIKVGEFFEEEN